MKKIGRETAEKTVNGKKKNAIVFALFGELGSGKTTFAQGFLEYFGIKKANSPTFVIMKKYVYENPKSKIQSLNKAKNPKFLPAGDVPKGHKIQKFYLYHIDCYRIHNSRDLIELGFQEIVKDSHNIILIEWADRIGDLLPKNTICINFKHKSENERIISIS